MIYIYDIYIYAYVCIYIGIPIAWPSVGVSLSPPRKSMNCFTYCFISIYSLSIFDFFSFSEKSPFQSQRNKLQMT